MGTCPIPRRLLLALLLAAALPGVFVGVEAEPLRLGPESVAAGPWMTLDSRGIVSVSIRLVPPVDPVRLRAVRPRIGSAALPLEASSRVVPAAGGAIAGQVVATWVLPPLTSGDVRFGAEPTAPVVHVPIPPGPEDVVRVMVVGGRAWPSADEVAASGAPPSVALVLGRVAAASIGFGGWEASVPLLLHLDRAHSDQVTGAILGDGEPAGVDLVFGCLGLPSTLRGPDVATDCAGRPRPWNVLLDPEARWDIGLQAVAEQADPRRLRTPLGIAKLLGMPMILSGGCPVGFVSEPLSTTEDGRLIDAPGGVRYVGATANGEGARALDAHVAATVDVAALAMLEASPTALRLNIGREVELAWGLDPQASSTGAGRIDVVPAVEAWRKDGSIAPGLAWVPRSTLELGEWSVLDLFALATPEGGAEPTEAARALARRLVADPEFIGDEPALLQRLPVWLRRDALLRWLAVPPSGDHGWIAVAASTDDRALVLALLASVERGAGESLRDALVQRLAGQAAGRIPIDDDPILQSRMASAVFDAPTLSPTPLRAIARDLEGKLSPLGAAPVKRFLERVGRFRPAE